MQRKGIQATTRYLFHKGQGISTIKRFFSRNQFLSLQQTHKEQLKRILNNNASLYIEDIEDLKSYNQDWLGKFIGKSEFAVRPKTTDQVSQILQYCNTNGIGVVPQGGNTGLVAGSTPPETNEAKDQIILSMSLMNEIISFDDKSGTLICQSGCVLEHLDNYLKQYGYMMPIDLGAKGSCHIGGNLATAAGGVRFIRYKSLHANILGMEIVLPNGTIVDSMKTVRKDNTGYHLPHLFIGAEGTLGVITKVALATAIRPKSINVVFLGIQTFEQVQHVFKAAKGLLGEILSAFEFFDLECMQLLQKHGLSNPLETDSKFFILLETHGSNQEHDEQKLERFFEEVTGSGDASDGTLAFDETQRLAIWKLRESITEALRKEGYVYKYDISIPLRQMYGIVEELRTKFSETPQFNELKVYGFGHLGDDNLHLNFVTPARNNEIEIQIEPYIYDWTRQHRGSISAEHGVGLIKKKFLHYSQTPESIALMKTIKKAIDPNNIMNPGKVLPDEI
jgi:FAD/FMN-containing dehydrogenase